MYADKQELIELMQDISSKINVPTIGIGGGYAPLGTINFFDATVAPQDWLACDGSVYNIADYPQLAEWYATQHGASNFYGGNGTTTFAVPDLQGEFLRGTGTNLHTNQGSGANVGVHQDGTVVAAAASWGPGAAITNYSSENYVYTRDSKISSGAYGRIDGLTQGSGDNWEAYTTRPTNTSFLICVKAVVAGEVYSTEERVVGTWIDGKKIYQKTTMFNSPITTSSNNWAFISEIDISTIDTIIGGKAHSTDNYRGVYNASFDIDNNKLELRGENSLSVKGVTLQYTKTV